MSDAAGDPVHTRRFWAKARPYGQPRPEKVHLLEHHACRRGRLLRGAAGPADHPAAGWPGAAASPRSTTRRQRGWRCSPLSTTSARSTSASRRGCGPPATIPPGRRPGYAGHYRELVAGADSTTTARPAAGSSTSSTGGGRPSTTWDDHDGETVCALFVAALSHHGRPLALEGDLSANPRLWRDYGELRPSEQLARVGALLRRWFPAAFDESALVLPARPEFQHMFLGLCTLADWIGSNEKWFTYARRAGRRLLLHRRPAGGRPRSARGRAGRRRAAGSRSPA